MNRKKLLFFINPKAGQLELRVRLLDLLDVFTAGGYEVTVHPTQTPRDLTERIARDGSRFDLVVCAGGDGTLNEAVSGLMQLEHVRPWAISPAAPATMWLPHWAFPGTRWRRRRPS